MVVGQYEVSCVREFAQLSAEAGFRRGGVDLDAWAPADHIPRYALRTSSESRS